MASDGSPDYMIYHPNRLRLSDIFCLLVLGRCQVGSAYLEASNSVFSTAAHGRMIGSAVIINSFIQNILLWISRPLALFGNVVQYILNFVSLNGGILGLLRKVTTGSLATPHKGSVDYKTIVGHIDGRTNLQKISTICNPMPVLLDNAENEVNILDLAIMAAKLAYENKAYIENVVTNHWKMYFVGQYRFWNEYLESKENQAFICCDRQKEPQLIVVAFSGTAPFNVKEWVTDLDMSWMSMGEMGKVHVGFMNALGLQDEKDYRKGWPKNYTGPKKLAYYTIREILKNLLQQNKGAKIIFTGHSLGGALSVLFPSILALHQEHDVMSSLLGVYTFGQPRVGDEVFGNFMKAHLNAPFKRYFRVVFHYDIIPRVLPFGKPLSQFAHFDGCHYYRNWYKGEVMKEEPNPNYLNPVFLPLMYLEAWSDLFRGLFARICPGNEFKESMVSILYRCIGLMIPGFSSHSPRDYANCARLAKVTVH